MSDPEPRLLRAFLAIYDAGGVSAAARRLGVSQPTMSGHLRRLRSHFADPLFVREGAGLAATARATEIRPLASQVVAGLEALAGGPARWDAGSSDRRFEIIASAYAQAVILPGLDARLRQTAPGLRLHVRPPGAGVDADTADLALWPSASVPAHQRMRALFTDRLICAVAPAVMPPGATIDLDAFCRLDHVLLAPAPSPVHDAVDAALARLGRKRRIVRVVSEPGGLPAILGGAPRLAILPARLAALAVPMLTRAPLPAELGVEPIRIAMSWPAAREDDAGHRWLRDAVIAATRGLARTLPEGA